MNIAKKDWYFLAIVAAVLIIFWAISGKEKTKMVPRDATHQQFYRMFEVEKKKKIEIDALCAPCHDGVQIPFPPNHPVKPGAGPMRCLFCHKLQR